MSNLAIEAAVTGSRRSRLHAFKRVLRRVESRVGEDPNAQRLSLSSAGYLYKRDGKSDRQQASTATEERSLRVGKDQLVVNPMWLTGGSIAVSDTEGAVSPDYRVFEPDKTRLDPRFLHHLLRSQPYRDQYDLFVRANTTFDRRIQQEDLDQLPLLLPKVVEQRRIADFLDDRVTRIDQIIRARQRQSRLLHWALASEVAGLVASGGEGWLTGSLRRFAKSCDSLRVPLSSEERATRQGKYPYYGASGVIDHVDDYLFDGPKVLVSEDGANLLLRSTAIAFVADGQYWVNNHAHILEPFDGAHDFWAARIEALDVSAWVTGSAQPKLTIDATMALPVSAPAQVEARVALGKQAVDARTAVEKRTWALEKSCTLMFEYKKSLITAAVTGELDVTTAGSGIPG